VDDTIQQELKELVGKFKFIQKLFYKYEELFLKMALKNEYFFKFPSFLLKFSYIFQIFS